MAVHTARSSSSSSLSSEHSNLISTTNTTPPPSSPTTSSFLPTRWLRRYKFFFIFVLLFLMLQIFLAYKSFSIPLFNNHSRYSQNNFISINSNLIDITNYNKQKNGNDKKKSELIQDDEDIHSNSNLYSLTNNNNNNSNNSNSKKPTNNKNDDLKLNFIPKCNIQTKEAISAIYRSKTDNCKKLIVNITCAIQNHTFYPKHLQSLCPNNKKFRSNHLIGCFKDEKNYRILSGYYINFKLNNSPEKCIQLCLQSGFVYAGVQYSTECFCGNDAPPVAAKLPDPSCNMKCPGDPKEACGGYFTVNIYETGIAKFTAQVAELTPKTTDEPVRIAFLLTLNGRALRQIHRLIKTLYNPRHYYFIHVDSRQDYLYRELLPLESQYKNIKIARNRFSTIWGGASLLTMLLTSMEYLLANSNWKWDFVINLSESDFPVKSIDKLSTFLTANKGKNFVKSHGREVQRFIQKQGLDKTFVECDTHMWRIGDRELPHGIQIDGGSDWIALSREFVVYLTGPNRDELIDGLRNVFKHTLLPAESFFHTVLRNSKFCNTYIDNNLHVTNWKRRLGCKCQYKHVVDWCGCSPNDFKPDDWNRLQATEAKQLFFARKFESIINQNIILQLEEWIYGPYPSDYANLNNYWQSVYHHKDKSPPPDDSLLTIVTSLIRINSVSYNYIPNNILEVTSYFENDHYKGFLILHEGYFENNRKYTVETLVKPNQIAKTSISSHIGKRIRMLEVSSDYDQKEQITRNFAKMIGPNSEPVLIFRLSAASATPTETNLNYNITILWIDPTGNLANVDDYHIEDGQSSSMNFIKSSLHQPLTPGVWTAKILNSKNIIGSCRFLVTPLQFVKRLEITSALGETLNYGHKYDNNNKFGTNHQLEYKNYLIAIEDRVKFKQKSLADSKRIGLDLQVWIDNLVGNFYTIKKSCIYNSNSSNSNNYSSNNQLDKNIELCQETTWSTFALDPKSDVSDLNKT